MSERIAIVGPSECGKTSLGMVLAQQYAPRGMHVLACDALGAHWPAKYQTVSVDPFLSMAKRAWGCALVIDEPGKRVRKAEDAEWLFTSSRHREHDLICLMHDGVQLTPMMRHQFTAICLFQSHPDVCEMWEREFNDPDLMLAARIPQYHFIVKERFKPSRQMFLSAEEAARVSAQVKGRRDPATRPPIAK